jgi:hypothetical protein
MDFFGSIRSKKGGSALTYERWCEFVSGCKDLVRPTPRTVRNPKTGEPMTIRPKPDSAFVILDAGRVGSVEWSQDGADEVFVIGDPEKIVPWATAVPAALGAEFAELPIK